MNDYQILEFENNAIASVTKLGAWLVHCNTDYVFDGNGPWTETDTPAPLSVNGQTKLEGEQLVAQHCPKHLILRTGWVCAARGGNFAKTMLRLGARARTPDGDRRPIWCPHRR